MIWRAFLLLIMSSVCALAADVRVLIDLSDQKMHVHVNNSKAYAWPVSTARQGKCTPTGTFTVKSMQRMHYSSLYNNAAMPFSIFFSGNYAIHGTTEVDNLGNPASAGCVRLHPDNAETLYNLVLENGRANTRITIVP